LIDSHDWLGTGSCQKTADRAQQEAQENLDEIVELIKESL
jgi:hypothetical protein